MKLFVSRYDILVAVSLMVLICYITSSYRFINDAGRNECAMTYMYEYPQFVKISVTDHAGQISQRYTLFAYSEGKYIDGAKSMRFNGIPVLFVPGHGGSFKQVRSLASVITHRTLDLQSIFHFDFFTIDFNGELSALYGGTLRDQHDFIILCINKVLQLYPAVNRPKSVVIIGHSMGGMIARSMFMNPDFDPPSVKLIITLATPHRPVILIDRDLKNFYHSVDMFWQTEKSKKNNRLENLTMISIGGGTKDILVRSGLTYNEQADLNVLTSAVPNVMTSTDHLCIVWCNNFIKTLSRALYDAVDFEIKGITEDKEHLRNVFYYHLVHCSNGKYYSPEIHRDHIKFSQKNSQWKEIGEYNASILFQHGVNLDTNIIIKKPENITEYNSIMIESINIDKRDWIAECSPMSSDNHLMVCENGINLSHLGTIGFNKTLNRKYLRMNLESSKISQRIIASHFVIRIPVTAENWEELQILKLILQTIPPTKIIDHPSVDLILDPACTYTVKIESSYLDSIAVIAIRYSLTLIANIAAVLMLTLASQYLSFGYRESCPSFLNALKRGSGPIFAYLVVMLITYCWSFFKLDQILGKVDTQLLMEDTADSIVVPSILYLVSFAILLVTGWCLQHSIRINVYIYRKYSNSKILTRTIIVQYPYAVNLVYKQLPVISAVTIMIVSLITCGGLAFIVGMIFHYTKICCIYKKITDPEEVYPENDIDSNDVILSAGVDRTTQKMDFIHIHSSLFLLGILSSITYLPSLIMWHHNRGLDSYLLQDPSFSLSIVYSCAMGFLWHCDVPYGGLSSYRLLSCVFFKIACVLLLTCQVNIFSLPTLLTVVFVCITIHQYSGLIKSAQILGKYFTWKNSHNVYFMKINNRYFKRKQN